jgi:hypothetical protein
LHHDRKVRTGLQIPNNRGLINNSTGR